MAGLYSSLTVLARFMIDLAERTGGSVDGGDSIPMQVAQSLAASLPADGVSVNAFDEMLRIPLGSSSPVALDAERLQTTLGEGPCIEAYETDRTVSYDLEGLWQKWPMFAEQLTDSTPYRSVLSVPLQNTIGRLGAIDCYWTDEQVPRDLSNAASSDDFPAVLTALVTAGHTSAGSEISDKSPLWFSTSSAKIRLKVWVAVGMIMSALRMDDGDALDVLRAAAFARGTTLDELALQLTNGRLSVRSLIGGA